MTFNDDSGLVKIQPEDVLCEGTPGYERGQRLKHAVIHATNYVCIERALLATEAYRIYEALPIAEKRAKVFEYMGWEYNY